MRLSVNKVISTATVLAMLVSSTASLPVVAEDSTVITKNYIKYDVATNTPTPYSLSIDVNYSDQTRAIIGETDERVRDGHNGIVAVDKATGFIVGDHMIATAAHCVHDVTSAAHADNYNFINDVSIFLYTNSGTMESGFQLTPVEIHVPYEYVNPVSDNADYSVDYALITVEEDLSAYTHFSLGVPYDMDTAGSQNLDIFVTGIPTIKPYEGEDEDVPNYLQEVYTGKGKIYNPPNAIPGVVYYTCDVTGGNSGGPVYIAYQYTSGSTINTVYTAIAVVGGENHYFVNKWIVEGNRGAAMVPSTIQFYKNNPYASY